MSVLLHPLVVGAAPLRLSGLEPEVSSVGVPARGSRDQRLEMQVESGSSVSPILAPALLSRAQRAHYRLSWQERFARNARAPTASRVMCH